MRPIAIDQRALRGAQAELGSAREALRSALGDDATQRTLDGLKRREQAALDDLEEMVLAERSSEEVQAQSAKVHALHRELVDARVEAHRAEVAADRERARADRAARHLEAAEQGRPRPVDEQAAWQAATELRDRRG